jgi:hypothetical protein
MAGKATWRQFICNLQRSEALRNRSRAPFHRHFFPSSYLEAVSYVSQAGRRHDTRVARFFLVHDTKTGKNVPNEHKMYQMVIKYPKCL